MNTKDIYMLMLIKLIMSRRVFLILLILFSVSIPSTTAQQYTVFTINSPSPFADLRGGETFTITGSFTRSDGYIPEMGEILVSFGGVNYAPDIEGNTWKTEFVTPEVKEPKEMPIKAWIEDKDGIYKETTITINVRPEIIIQNIRTDKDVYLEDDIIKVELNLINAQGDDIKDALVSLSLEGYNFDVREEEDYYFGTLDLSNTNLEEGNYNIRINAVKKGYFDAQQANKTITIGQIISTLNFWNSQRTEIIQSTEPNTRIFVKGSVYVFGWQHNYGELEIYDGEKKLEKFNVPIINGTWEQSYDLGVINSSYITAKFVLEGKETSKVLQVDSKETQIEVGAIDVFIGNEIRIELYNIMASRNIEGILIYTLTDKNKTYRDSMMVNIETTPKDIISPSWPHREFQVGEVKCIVEFMHPSGQITEIAHTNFTALEQGELIQAIDIKSDIYSDTQTIGKELTPTLIVWNRTNRETNIPTYTGVWLRDDVQASSPISTQETKVSSHTFKEIPFGNIESNTNWGTEPRFEAYLGTNEYKKPITIIPSLKTEISIQNNRVKAFKEENIIINTEEIENAKVSIYPYLERNQRTELYNGNIEQTKALNVSLSEGLHILEIEYDGIVKRDYIFAEKNPIVEAEIEVKSDSAVLKITNKGSNAWMSLNMNITNRQVILPIYVKKDEQRQFSVPLANIPTGQHNISLNINHKGENIYSSSEQFAFEARDIFVQKVAMERNRLTVTVDAKDMDSPSNLKITARGQDRVDVFEHPLPNRLISFSNTVQNPIEIIIELTDDRGGKADVIILNEFDKLDIELSGWNVGQGNVNTGLYPLKRTITYNSRASVRLIQIQEPESMNFERNGMPIGGTLSKSTYNGMQMVDIRAMEEDAYNLNLNNKGIRLESKEITLKDEFEGYEHTLTFVNEADKRISSIYYWGNEQITSNDVAINFDGRTSTMVVTLDPKERKTIRVRTEPHTFVTVARAQYERAKEWALEYGHHILFGIGIFFLILFLSVLVRTKKAKRKIKKYYNDDGKVTMEEVTEEVEYSDEPKNRFGRFRKDKGEG